MKLSIIMPVYNEEATIGVVIEKLIKLPLNKEIIIINDGSEDNTFKVINSYQRFGIITKHLPVNKGKGNAIKIGLYEAKGDLIMIQDADLEYNPEDIPKLVTPIVNGEALVVYGNRFEKNITGPFWHRLINKFLTFLTNILYLAKLSDMETCYKVARADIWRRLDLKSRRFEVEAEITAKILRYGYKIHEVPIRYQRRSYRQGKKIGFRDGILTIYTLFKYRLVRLSN